MFQDKQADKAYKLSIDTMGSGAIEANGVRFASAFAAPPTFSVEEQAVRQRVLGEIERLDLVRNAYELECNGYTVLKPEQVATTSFVDELRATVLRIAEKNFNQPIDVKVGASLKNVSNPFGQVKTDIGVFLEDPIFEKVLMNPATLALITYLLGESCILQHFTSAVKGPGTDYLPMHADQNRLSSQSPMPLYAQVANATWVLSDYSKENGSTCFVPGSHKLCRAPTRDECMDLALFAEPITAPPGSVIVWHGHTWHGAVPRTNPGVRVGLITYFSRWYHWPVDPLESFITKEMLDRNSPRFAILTRANDFMNNSSAKGNLARFSTLA
jgi:hypothetical protein